MELASIMMVTFNRLNLTKKTLKSIYDTANYPFELIIIDNYSTDETVEYLKSLKDIHLILNKENKGIGRARNQALLKANELDTIWYVTIDNDVLLPTNWLKECIEILKDNKNFGQIGVNFEGTNYPLISNNEKQWQEKPAGNLGTALTVFHKSFHKMLGFYNTEYNNLYSMEDSDFGMRARVAGFKLGYIKEPGIHLGESFDTKEYKEFKAKEHAASLPLFQQNAAKYFRGEKNIFIPYKD